MAKGREAESFNDKMQEAARRRITSEIWDICYALEESLCSVIMDDELPWESKADAMKESLTQFDTAMADMIPAWSSGKTANKIVKNEQPITTARLEVAKAAKEKLEAIIAKAEKTPETDPEDTSVQDGCKDPKTKKSKGEPQDMKIDKSKLTPEELAALEAIEKKAGQNTTHPLLPNRPRRKGAATEPRPITTSRDI